MKAFESWMRAVDAELGRIAGVTHMDIGDQRWRDMWEDGENAEDAAREALEEEGFPFEDD